MNINKVGNLDKALLRNVWPFFLTLISTVSDQCDSPAFEILYLSIIAKPVLKIFAFVERFTKALKEYRFILQKNEPCI